MFQMSEKRYRAVTFAMLVLTNSVPLTMVAGSMASSVALTETRVSAIVGAEVELPCDTSTPIKNDSVLLIVLYKNDEPIYSYDTRVTGPSAHWVEDDYIGRVDWYDKPTPRFRIQNLKPEDREMFMCRVDFHVAQTRNYKVAVDVIELPQTPQIFDEFGREVKDKAGPYREGGEFKLVCSVKGGSPVPRIQWRLGDTVISTLGPSEFAPPVRTLNLVILNVTRAHFALTYSCTADNTLLAEPRKTSVKIDVHLKPLKVNIIDRDLPISLDRKAELRCTTFGARPPANLTWWLHGRKLNGAVHQVIKETQNETESIIEWMPNKDQNGKKIICRAEHSSFSKYLLEDEQKLNIYYMPNTTIRLGPEVNPNDIEEGDDVYFDCNVDANPPAYKIVWEHNGVVLQNNPAQGIIVTGNTNLALRSVSRHQAGVYTCSASNVEGDGRSQNLHMQVIYRPICEATQMKIVGAALQEPAVITCEVNAFPPPDSFQWTLNSSAGYIKVDPDRFTIDGKQGKSILTYTPVSDVDYGTLACRATNLGGQQAVPCVYTILPATKPDPPTNCTVYNLTHDSLDLLCQPGYDGGLHCVYVVEVWGDNGLVVNASNDGTLWNLRRLGAGRNLRLIVYAANARGRSEHSMFTVKTAFKSVAWKEPEELWELNWAFGIILGTATTIALILCCAFISSRFRQRSRDYEVSLPTLKNQKIVVQKRNTTPSTDDMNPDLIPLNKGGSLEICHTGFEPSTDSSSLKGASEMPPDPPQYSAITQPKNSNTQPRAQSPLLPILSHTYADTQPDSALSIVAEVKRPHYREIVTTRTPLMYSQQESCV